MMGTNKKSCDKQINIMGVIPPKDGDVWMNSYGTVILNVKTLYRMTADQYKDQVKKLVDKALSIETEDGYGKAVNMIFGGDNADR